MDITATVIHGTNAEIVQTYKCKLGTVFDDRLRFCENTDIIEKKFQQHLYSLHKLNSFHVDKTLLTMLYSSFFKVFEAFKFICWIKSLYQKYENCNGKVLSILAQKTQRSLVQLHSEQVLKKAYQIINYPTRLFSAVAIRNVIQVACM